MVEVKQRRLAFPLTVKVYYITEREVKAWVYNELRDPAEPDANFIIEETKKGQFSLVLLNSIYTSSKLSELEKMLFDWMEEEGIKPVSSAQAC